MGGACVRCRGSSSSIDAYEPSNVETEALDQPSPFHVPSGQRREDPIATQDEPTSGTTQWLGWTTPRLERGEWANRLQPPDYGPPRRRDETEIRGVLGGMSWKKLPRELRRSIRFMISSTFTDTAEERNALISDVTPYLQEYSRLRRMEYLAVEMRWGIRDATSVNTNKICMQELQRCKEESIGISYVMISGNKYGFRAIPSEIPATEFDALTKELEGLTIQEVHAVGEVQNSASCELPSGDGLVVKLLQSSFELDLNSGVRSGDIVVDEAGPTYTFKMINDNIQYSVIQKALRLAASRIWPEDCTVEGLRDALRISRAKNYFVSVTEEELSNGLLWDEARDNNAIVYRRRFKGGVPLDAGGDPGKFVDMSREGILDSEAQDLLHTQQEQMLPSVFKGRLKEYDDLEWGPGVNLNRNDHLRYIRDFCDDFCDQICASIDQACFDLHIEEDEVADEALRHLRFAKERADMMLVTETTQMLSSCVQEYLKDTTEPAAVTLPLVIWGNSGSGKTFLMSDFVRRSVHIADTDGGFVVARFLGTSPKSCSVRMLMESVTNQIFRLYGRHLSVNKTTDFESLKEVFAQAVTQLPSKDMPLFLLLDSLDQLNSSDQGRELTWLLPVINNLPPCVRVLLSTLPDHTGIFQCLSVLQSVLEEKCFVAVQNVAKPKDVLEFMLRQNHRSVTESQMDIITASYDKMCDKQKNSGYGSFLWLRLAAHNASYWKSFDDLGALPMLEHSVVGIITQLFAKLEDHHGSHLVSATLGWIALSKGGLSMTEIQGLLSLDDDVLADAYEWWVPPLRIIPPLLPTRLLSDLKKYIASRGDSSGQVLLSFYHRQFQEASCRRYLLGNSTVLSLSQFGGSLSMESLAQAPILRNSSSHRIVLSMPAQSQRTGVWGAQAVQRRERYKQIAEYFGSVWAAQPKPYSHVLRRIIDKQYPGETAGNRFVPSHPLVLAGDMFSAITPPSLNFRRIEEYVPSLIGCMDEELAIQELCSVEYFSAKLMAGHAVDLQHELSDAQKAFFGCSGAQRINDFQEFLSLNRHVISKRPDLILQQALLLPPLSQVFIEVKNLLLRGIKYSNQLLLPVTNNTGHDHFRVKCNVIASAGRPIVDVAAIKDHFVSVIGDGSITVHSVITGLPAPSLQHKNFKFVSVASAHQSTLGPMLLVGEHGGHIIRWTGPVLCMKAVCSEACLGGSISSVVTSEDGSVAACLSVGQAHILDVNTLEFYPIELLLPGKVTCLDVSSDGQFIALGSSPGCCVQFFTTASLGDDSSRNCVSLKHVDITGGEVEFDEVGAVALCSSKMWGASGLKCFREMLGDKPLFYGPIVLWSYDSMATNGLCVLGTFGDGMWGPSFGGVVSLAFSASGSRLISVCSDWSGPRLWDCSSLQCIMVFNDHPTMATVAMISGDGMTGITCDQGGCAKVRNFENLESQILPPKSFDQATLAVSTGKTVRHLRPASSDGLIFLSAGADGVVRIFERKGVSIRQIESHHVHGDDVNRLSLSKKDSQGRCTVVTSSDDKTVCVWALDSAAIAGASLLKCTTTLCDAEAGWLEAVYISRSGNMIVSGDNFGVARVYKNAPQWSLYQAINSQKVCQGERKEVAITSVCCSEGGDQICLGCTDGSIFLYSHSDQDLCFALAVHVPHAHNLDPSRDAVEVFVDLLDDDKTVLSVGDMTLKIWDLNTLCGLCEYPIEGYGRRFEVCGSQVAVSCWNGWVYIFEASTVNGGGKLSLGCDYHPCRNGLQVLSQLCVNTRVDGFVLSEQDSPVVIYGDDKGDIGLWQVRHPTNFLG